MTFYCISQSKLLINLFKASVLQKNKYICLYPCISRFKNRDFSNKLLSFNANNSTYHIESPEIARSKKTYSKNTDSGITVNLDFDSSISKEVFDAYNLKRAINVLQPPKLPSDIDVIKPQIRPSYNIAAYIDRSDVLKQFLNLGVKLANWDGDLQLCSRILSLNFENEIKPYIFFLNDSGLSSDKLGKYLTDNPDILFEKLENLHVRLQYLKSKKFSKKDISHIIFTAPKWLNINTVVLDKELGQFQKKFLISGKQMRLMIGNDPKLIPNSIDNYFSIERHRLMVQDEFGFSFHQTKKLLVNAPSIFRTDYLKLSSRFDVAHIDIGFPLDTIVNFPSLLTTCDRRMSERLAFLQLIDRAQFDPLKPNYVFPTAITDSTDVHFALSVAGVKDVEIYNDFLKTL